MNKFGHRNTLISSWSSSKEWSCLTISTETGLYSSKTQLRYSAKLPVLLSTCMVSTSLTETSRLRISWSTLTTMPNSLILGLRKFFTHLLMITCKHFAGHLHMWPLNYLNPKNIQGKASMSGVWECPYMSCLRPVSPLIRPAIKFVSWTSSIWTGIDQYTLPSRQCSFTVPSSQNRKTGPQWMISLSLHSSANISWAHCPHQQNQELRGLTAMIVQSP